MTDQVKRDVFIEFSNLMISLKTSSSYQRLFSNLMVHQDFLIEKDYQDLEQIYNPLIKFIKDDPGFLYDGQSLFEVIRAMICRNINSTKINNKKYIYDKTTKLLTYLFQTIIEAYSNDPNIKVQYLRKTQTMEEYLIKFLEEIIEKKYFQHHYVELINLIKLTIQKILQTKKFSNESFDLDDHVWKLYRVLKHLEMNIEMKNQTTILEQRAKTLNILLENINNLKTHNTKRLLNDLYKAGVSDGFYTGLQNLMDEARMLVSGLSPRKLGD